MELYRYIFYTRYKRWLKSEKWKSTAHFSAVMDIALLTFINGLTILMFVQGFVFHRNFLKQETQRKELFIPVAICLLLVFIIHYIFLVHKKKHIEILKEFDDNHNGKLKIYYWLYIFFSFSLPVLIGYILSKIL